MIDKKSWNEFRESGLFLFINSILHAFGWAIVFEMDGDVVKGVFPARVKFRGFDEDSISESHKKIGAYLKNNIDEIYKETQE